MNPAEWAVFRQTARLAYKGFLRRLLKSAINDPESLWDDRMMAVCDAVFGYSEEKKRS